jgi:peptidyl-prolyl cis-trans isomerase SDCCAG10
MSSSYTLEPKTQGKVILTTSVGECEVELWPKEAPKACRNFVQLCLEGFYNDCPFHRIIKDFIVQTGGSKNGEKNNFSEGESIFGEKFEDEFHSRLKFTHRGLLACAGEKNKNDSQFFITMDKTEALNFKHTIFAKIVGDTIFNIMKMNEYEVDGDDKPLYPPKIIKTEVIWNPFDDIVPRIKQKVVVKKKKGVKNLSLLSFEEEEIQEDGSEKKSISIHDLVQDKKLSSKSSVELKEIDVEVEDFKKKNLKSKIVKIINEEIKIPQEEKHKPETKKISEIEEKLKQNEPETTKSSFGKNYLQNQKEKYMKKRFKIKNDKDALEKVELFSKNLSKSKEFSSALKFKKSETDEDPSDGFIYEVIDPIVGEEPSQKKIKYE